MKLISDMFWTCVAVFGLVVLLFAWPVKADILRPVSGVWAPLTTSPVTSLDALGGGGAALAGPNVKVRVTCTAACAVDFKTLTAATDTFVTATSSPTFLPANTPEIFGVNPSEFMFFEGTAAGHIYYQILR